MHREKIQDFETIDKDKDYPIHLFGGIVEDYYLIEWAEKEGRIVPDGTLEERVEDSISYLTFLGYTFIRE